MAYRRACVLVAFLMKSEKTMAGLTNGFQRSEWPRTEGGTLWLQRPGPRGMKETQGSHCCHARASLLCPSSNLPLALQPGMTSNRTHSVLFCVSAGLWEPQSGVQCHLLFTLGAQPGHPPAFLAATFVLRGHWTQKQPLSGLAHKNLLHEI